MKKYSKIIFALFAALLIAGFASRSVFLANTYLIDKIKLAMTYQLIKERILRVPRFLANLPSIFKIGKIGENQNQLSQGISPITPMISPVGTSKVLPISQDQSLNEILTKTVLKETTKGVYAGEYDEVSVYQYDQDSVDWVAYTFTLADGRTITINVPRGQPAPTQDEAEAISGK